MDLIPNLFISTKNVLALSNLVVLNFAEKMLEQVIAKFPSNHSYFRSYFVLRFNAFSFSRMPHICSEECITKIFSQCLMVMVLLSIVRAEENHVDPNGSVFSHSFMHLSGSSFDDLLTHLPQIRTSLLLLQRIGSLAHRGWR